MKTRFQRALQQIDGLGVDTDDLLDELRNIRRKLDNLNFGHVGGEGDLDRLIERAELFAEDFDNLVELLEKNS